METIYTPAQMADLFQLSERTIKDKAYSHEWPCLKLGPRTIRFTEDHYRQIVAQTEQQPAARESRRDRNKNINDLLKNI